MRHAHRLKCAAGCMPIRRFKGVEPALPFPRRLRLFLPWIDRISRRHVRLSKNSEGQQIFSRHGCLYGPSPNSVQVAASSLSCLYSRGTKEGIKCGLWHALNRSPAGHITRGLSRHTAVCRCRSPTICMSSECSHVSQPHCSWQIQLTG